MDPLRALLMGLLGYGSQSHIGYFANRMAGGAGTASQALLGPQGPLPNTAPRVLGEGGVVTDEAGNPVSGPTTVPRPTRGGANQPPGGPGVVNFSQEQGLPPPTVMPVVVNYGDPVREAAVAALPGGYGPPGPGPSFGTRYMPPLAAEMLAPTPGAFDPRLEQRLEMLREGRQPTEQEVLGFNAPAPARVDVPAAGRPGTSIASIHPGDLLETRPAASGSARAQRRVPGREGAGSASTRAAREQQDERARSTTNAFLAGARAVAGVAGLSPLLTAALLSPPRGPVGPTERRAAGRVQRTRAAVARSAPRPPGR